MRDREYIERHVIIWFYHTDDLLSRSIQDKRELLLPWIAVMVTNVLVECAHFLYLVYCESVRGGNNL